MLSKIMFFICKDKISANKVKGLLPLSFCKIKNNNNLLPFYKNYSMIIPISKLLPIYHLPLEVIRLLL